MRRMVPVNTRVRSSINSIATIIFVAIPALVIMFLFDGQLLQYGYSLTINEKILLSLGFLIYTICISTTLLLIRVITAFGYSVCIALAISMMGLYLSSGLSLLAKLLVTVSSIILAIPIFSLSNWLSTRLLSKITG